MPSTSERTLARRPPGTRTGWGIIAAATTVPHLGEAIALLATLSLAAGLNLLLLDQQGFGNTYYAAAVKSMLTSWHNFLFASFDAGGFVTVDKPPVGLWAQVLSVRLFGFIGTSLFLPQAIAGVLSVAVLYWLVRRAYGAAAGCLAALALAITPISVATNRNNTIDSLLVLVLLLAAWAAARAAEGGRLRPLLACAALVGLGFNIKMLQAYPVLPGFWLAYLLWAPRRLPARLAHLTLATLLLLAVSLSWSVMVDLTPPEQRPYVGSSGSNSALSLVLGYNGLGRVTAALTERIPLPPLAGGLTIDLSVMPAFAPQIGPPSLERLLRTVVADQASWLLPLALLGLLATATQLGSRGQAAGDPDEQARSQQLRQQRVALVIWGSWLLAWGTYFSFARFYHLYYLVMLAPAVAALTGIGIAALWQAFRGRSWSGWLLPLGLLGTTALQVMFVARYPLWSSRLTPILLITALPAAVGLLLGRRWLDVRPAVGSAVIGLLSLFLVPATWSGLVVADGSGGAWLPQAGPIGGPGLVGGPGGRFAFPANRQQPGFPTGGPPGRAGGAPPPVAARGGTAFTFAGQQWNGLDPALVRFLMANQGSARFLVATPSSTYASLFILATNQPAMALGGYQGWDKILTLAGLAELTANGTVRFFLLSSAPGRDRSVGPADATSDLTAWVQSTCTAVPAQLWQAGPSAQGGGGSANSDQGFGRQPARGFGPGLQAQQVYDCAPAGRGPLA